MTLREHFHQASWQEPLITDQGEPGQRGVTVPAFDGPSNDLPLQLSRTAPPALPELGQAQVLRHFMRLSQMTLAHNVALDATAGTTSPKYPPVINEQLARSQAIAELHPAQPAGTVQGLLRLLWELGECLKALSGMDAVALQPQGGAHAIFANVLIIKAFHASRGNHERDEMISTLASHPTNPASAAAAGFKIIEIPVGPRGYVEAETLKAAVSERTAGFFLNNPEDTGVFNPDIDKLGEIVHDAGALCAYDQANANATLGLARARDAGFDLCQFNLHKTFGAPMNLYGPSAGAVCVTAELEPFLPTPVVIRTDDVYSLDYDRPQSIGPIRSYAGNIAALVKAYAWIRALGPQWISEVARTSILNNNYLSHQIRQLRGISIAYPQNTDRRLDLVRYSAEQLKHDTGIGTEDLNGRITDFGVPAHWTSHHPFTTPEPFTIEPTETFSRVELDELGDIYRSVVDEAYSQPHTILSAPHRSSVAKMRVRPEGPDDADIPLATARLLRRYETATKASTVE